MTPEERETVQMEVTKEAMEALIALLTKRDKRIAELEASEQKWINTAEKWKKRAIELLPKKEQKP